MRQIALLLRFGLLSCILFSFQPALAETASQGEHRLTSFDSNWLFIKGDPANAQSESFDDSAWRKLDVPHDWSIEGPVAQNNPAGGAGGFFPTGIGWYRRHFSVPDDDAAKRVFIDFDGVMSRSDVWINGFHLGDRPYGYVSFRYELSGHLHIGAGSTNVLAVRANNQDEPASRFYAGAGIVRHVWLVACDPVHFEHWSLFVSTPEVAADHAVIHVQGRIINQSDRPRAVVVKPVILGPDGTSAATTQIDLSNKSIEPGKSLDFSADLRLAEPKLWDLDHPQMYSAHVIIDEGDKELDAEDVSFGIRSFKFVPETGFELNGKNIRIQGACLHSEASAFGSAVPIAAWEHRLTALKSIGVNAIRTAHNPVAPEFLDLCDRMGFVVMDEMFDCWEVAKNKYDYHLYFDQWSLIDLRDTVQRDRNHPSIFLYSAGNEIHDTPNAAKSKVILAGLVHEFHANDPTRPVTQALLRPNASHDYDNGLADLLDVVGTNYRMAELLAAQKAKPTRAIIGTENGARDGAILAKNAPLAGIFIWAGADYLGESRAWPRISSQSGLIDRIDRPKLVGYQIATRWLATPFVHIVRGAGGGPPQLGPDGAPAVPATRPQARAVPRGRGNEPQADWTPANLAAHPEIVTVYSNCQRVELFLNGTSLGASSQPDDNGGFRFNVNFAPGALKAVGFVAANEAATDELHTAGAPAKIVLLPHKPILSNAWDDVSFVEASVTDAQGIVVPSAANEITFNVAGAGALAAVDSADSANHEDFHGARRQAYMGRCVAVVKATAPTGQITITATAPDLADGTASVAIAPAAQP